MNRTIAAVLMLTVVLVSPSCRNEFEVPVLSNAEHSGFGYVAGFYGNNAELLMVVDWPNDEVVDLVVRCKAEADSDSDACTISTEGAAVQIVVPEKGVWSSVPLRLQLKRGRNTVEIVGAKPMKDDVLIDYIEIR